MSITLCFDSHIGLVGRTLGSASDGQLRLCLLSTEPHNQQVGGGLRSFYRTGSDQAVVIPAAVAVLAAVWEIVLAPACLIEHCSSANP